MTESKKKFHRCKNIPKGRYDRYKVQQDEDGWYVTHEITGGISFSDVVDLIKFCPFCGTKLV